jgi:predicted enzyme related to lactoylglutathione lyase
MNKDTNSLNWFEICVTDLVRAKHFYETAFGITLESWDLPGMQMLVFPSVPGNGKASGALVKSEMHTPSMDGSVIYLNVGNGLDAVLSRVAEAGGEILMPKTDIGPQGFIAQIRDTEGNKVGLHQPA